MKTKHTLISIVLAAGIIISGLAFASDWGNRGSRKAGFHRPHKAFALMLLVKYQQKNLMVQTLSEMTDQSVESLETQLKDQRMHTIMQDLDIDREAFRTAMQAKISQRVKKSVNLRDGAGQAKITVHMGTCGIAAGARKIMNTLMDEIEKKNLDDVILTNSGCAGLCSKEPMATVEVKDQTPVKYVDLTPEKIRRILDEHVLGGTVVQEYALAAGSERMS